MKKINKIEIIELLNKSKKIVGLRQVLKNILDGTIKCVIVSIDSEDFVLNTIKDRIKDKDIKVIKALTSREIADICKIDVPSSVVGILSN